MHSSATEVATVAAPTLAFKANLDFRFIKDNLQLVTDNCKIRNSQANPTLVAELYDEYLKLKKDSDMLRASRNENSTSMKVWAASSNAVFRLFLLAPSTMQSFAQCQRHYIGLYHEAGTD